MVDDSSKRGAQHTLELITVILRSPNFEVLQCMELKVVN